MWRGCEPHSSATRSGSAIGFSRRPRFGFARRSATSTRPTQAGSRPRKAFSKALGTGLRGAIGWTEIDVCDNERTRPTIRVTGRAEKILAGRKGPPQHLAPARLRYGNRGNRRLARPRQNQRHANGSCPGLPDCPAGDLAKSRRPTTARGASCPAACGIRESRRVVPGA